MKIGILGGTFNPIHIGHLMLGEFSYEAFDLDEVWFLPNSKPPHKNSEDIKTSDEMRLSMIEKSIADISYFKVREYEMNQDKVFYTYETMEYLKCKYPNDEFYFIIGSDSLFSIEKWMNIQRIFACCAILVAYRKNGEITKMDEQIEYLNEKYQAKIYKLDAPILEVSSSNIRERVEENRSIKYLVPDPVIDYIKSYNLYKKDD